MIGHYNTVYTVSQLTVYVFQSSYNSFFVCNSINRGLHLKSGVNSILSIPIPFNQFHIKFINSKHLEQFQFNFIYFYMLYKNKKDASYSFIQWYIYGNICCLLLDTDMSQCLHSNFKFPTVLASLGGWKCSSTRVLFSKLTFQICHVYR